MLRLMCNFSDEIISVLCFSGAITNNMYESYEKSVCLDNLLYECVNVCICCLQLSIYVKLCVS